MILRFSKELYPKIAMIKAAYHFTPHAYVHLDADNTHYIVELSSKGTEVSILPEEFTNEILAQTTRLAVLERTEHLRELIMARAFASTIIEPQPEEEQAQTSVSDEELHDILRNWYAE